MPHNFMTLSPKDAIGFIVETLEGDITKRHRVLLHGPPGVGKSKALVAVAKLMNANLYDLRLLQLEAPDIRGLTMIDPASGETKHMRPEFLPVYTENPNATKVIIFLDELLGTHDSVRKSAFELILDHRVGPHRLGDNVYLIGAGNSAEDGTNVYELDAATADRFCHIMLEPTIQGFVEHGNENGFHPALLAFIQSHPECLMPTEQDIQIGNIARPSPRSLERCSEVLYRNYSKAIYRNAAIKGWIGEYAGSLLITDLDDAASRFDLMKLIQAKPEDREYPTSQFGIYNLAQSLASYADTPEKLDTAMEIMLATPDTLNHAVEECKTSFFFAVEAKMRNWKLIAKYAVDPRVGHFLDRTDEIINGADRPDDLREAA